MGSSPSIGSDFGEILKRPTRTDCKSVGFTFAGSNPAPPTKIVRRNNRDRRFFEILESLDENPEKNAGVAQLVERQPSKLNVAGSNPVSRSI